MSIKLNVNEFLGTIAGDQKYTDHCGRPTYSRVLDGALLSSCLQSFRERIFTIPVSENYKKIGEDYQGTGKITVTMGGGYFQSIKIQKDRYEASSHEYAIEKMIDSLEALTGLHKEEILGQCKGYGIEYMLNRYFQGIEYPQDGDLVVYFSAEKNHPVHVGIYRNSARNRNSPRGGTVESKWTYFSHYAFQHDFFFLPPHCGNLAQFFRVKVPGTLEPETLPLKHDDSINGPMELLQEDGTYQFVANESNRAIRHEISKTATPKMAQIHRIHDIHFFGVCYGYALAKILKTYGSSVVFGEGEMISCKPKILEKYFTRVTDPKAGDLANYYNGSLIVHYGVVLAPGLIESKWGTGDVYRHPPFYVDNRYGNKIAYFRLKSEYSPEQVIAELKNENESNHSR